MAHFPREGREVAFSTRQTLEALALKRLRALAENVSLLLQGKVHPDSQSSHIFLATRAIFSPPIAAFLLGYTLLWIMRGFRP